MKTYTKPALVQLGNVRELTLGGSSGGGHHGGGHGSHKAGRRGDTGAAYPTRRGH